MRYLFIAFLIGCGGNVPVTENGEDANPRRFDCSGDAGALENRCCETGKYVLADADTQCVQITCGEVCK